MTIFSIRLIYVVLSILLIAGQFLFTLGCEYSQINMMFLGRIIFGLGGESFIVITKFMLSRWFLSKELATPIGVALGISKLGNAFNDMLSPIVSNVIYIII